MSASGSVSSGGENVFPGWLSSVREDDRDQMALIEPFVYFGNELEEKKFRKRADECFSRPFRYTPFIYPHCDGTTQKVYLYYKVLEFINIPYSEAHSTDFGLGPYRNVLGKLKELTPSERLRLHCIKPFFGYYRASKRSRTGNRSIKKIEPTNAYHYLFKFNKKHALYLIKTVLSQISPSVVVKIASECPQGIDQGGAASFDERLLADDVNQLSAEEKATLLARTVKFKVGVGINCIGVLSNKGLEITTTWNQTIGTGFYSRALKSCNYLRGEFQVYKESNLEVNGQDHVHNEVRILKIIYSGISENKLPGILERPIAVFTFPDPTDPSRVYQEPVLNLYPQAIRRYLHRSVTPDNPLLTLQNLLSGAIQLFQGLRHLEERKILHGDIKLENVLLESENPLVPRLIDFGGCILEDEAPIYCEQFYGETFSPIYFDSSDCLEMVRYAASKQFDKWILVYRARDVAGMLALLLEVFSKQYIDTESENGWIGSDHVPEMTALMQENGIQLPKTVIDRLSILLDLRKASREEITKMLKNTGCAHPKLIDLFVSGLQSDWRLRPSVETILNSLIELQSHP